MSGFVLLLGPGEPAVPIIAVELAVSTLVGGILFVTGHSASRRIQQLLAGMFHFRQVCRG